MMVFGAFAFRGSTGLAVSFGSLSRAKPFINAWEEPLINCYSATAGTIGNSATASQTPLLRLSLPMVGCPGRHGGSLFGSHVGTQQSQTKTRLIDTPALDCACVRRGK